MNMDMLPFFLPRQQSCIFREENDPSSYPGKQFTAWMETNRNGAETRNLMYMEFHSKWIWDGKTRKWCPLLKGTRVGAQRDLF
ncbi:hypothetical protein EUTSA_v10023785mg [Eutrema salsugineum]|uniref:Uncharacterized protein n=1 Tax=Eutrema salsugineum TaxID=72664 RepID=V4JUX0_EUTSA|nr:hypothetical protein EUTSA_v10023785mg [Eutrema salsugineum]ESQ29170.1 hypothetical protein EUTSA_v10023785mg [Eutrema salsugineum]